MGRINPIILIWVLNCLTANCMFAQNNCVIATDTFKYIGQYNYSHNYFTEDTVINASNIKTYFNNLPDGKFYFKSDTSLCAFTINNGFFDDKLYYFDGRRLTLYSEYSNNILQVKYICWGSDDRPYYDVSFYSKGQRKIYIKQSAKKPYIITLNKKVIGKTPIVKRKVKKYFTISKRINYPACIN
jgi:hypothetical protein